MTYVKIPTRLRKQCIRYGCLEATSHVIVSLETLRKRKTNPAWGTHYYACPSHVPANAKEVKA